MTSGGEVSGRGDRWIRLASRVLFVALPASVAGAAGYLLLTHHRGGHRSAFQSFLWACHVSGHAASAGLAHHSLHLAFAGGAVIVFTMYALRDVARRGWPSFSWKLRPETPERPAS